MFVKMDKKYVETVGDALPSGDVFIQLEDIAYINGPIVVLRNKVIKLTPCGLACLIECIDWVAEHRSDICSVLDFNIVHSSTAIQDAIDAYIDKHPTATICGSEYIMQDDEAQEDALELVCNIFDFISSSEEKK